MTLGALIALLILSGVVGSAVYSRASGLTPASARQASTIVSKDPSVIALMNLVNSAVESASGSYPTPSQSPTPPTQRTCGELAFDLQWVEQQIIGETPAQIGQYDGLLQFYWDLYSTPHSIASGGPMENCLVNPGTAPPPGNGTTSVEITSTSLTVASNLTRASIALQNTGQTSWSVTSVTVGTVSIPSSDCPPTAFHPIDPGQSTTCLYYTTSGSFTIGVAYPVSVSVTSTGGTTSSATATVTATGLTTVSGVAVSILSANLTLSGSYANFIAALRNTGNTTWTNEYVELGAATPQTRSVCQNPTTSTRVGPGQTYNCVYTTSSGTYTNGTSYPVLAGVTDTNGATATATTTVTAVTTAPQVLSAVVTGTLALSNSTSDYGVLNVSIANNGTATITRVYVSQQSQGSAEPSGSYTVSIAPGATQSITKGVPDLATGATYVFQVVVYSTSLSRTYTLTVVAPGTLSVLSAALTGSISMSSTSAGSGTLTLNVDNNGTATITGLGVYAISSNVVSTPAEYTVSIAPGATTSEQVSLTDVASGTTYNFRVYVSSGTQSKGYTLTLTSPGSAGTLSAHVSGTLAVTQSGTSTAAGSLSVTLVNTGTLNITRVYGEFGPTSSTATLPSITLSGLTGATNISPGATVIGTAAVQNIAAGQTYILVVTIVGSNGASQAYTTELTAQS